MLKLEKKLLLNRKLLYLTKLQLCGLVKNAEPSLEPFMKHWIEPRAVYVLASQVASKPARDGSSLGVDTSKFRPNPGTDQDHSPEPT